MVAMNKRGMGEELVFLLFLFFGLTFMLLIMLFIWSPFQSIFASLGVPAVVYTTGASTIAGLGKIIVFAFFTIGLLSIALVSRLNASPIYYVASLFMIVVAIFMVPVAQLGIEVVTNASSLIMAPNMTMHGLNDTAAQLPLVMATWNNMGAIILLIGIVGIAVTYGRGRLFRTEAA